MRSSPDFLWRAPFFHHRFFIAASLLIIATGTVANSQTPPERPKLQILRYDEDWSVLRDPSLRTEALDALKFIGLGENSLLTLGGEARIRYEKFVHPGFGGEREDPTGYLLHRYLIHADFHASPELRLFTQVQSSFVAGRLLGPRPTDRDELDLQQVFVDYDIDGSEGATSTVRLGRQEIELGSARLISVRDPLNVRLSHDGARFISDLSSWYYTAFIVRPVVISPGVMDDGIASNGYLWALAAQSPILPGPLANLVLFYHGQDRLDGRYETGTARETRHTLGFRTWGSLAAPWELELSWIGQTGSFGNKSIFAWATTSDLGHTFAASTRPRLGLKLNAASGDGDRSDDSLGTFNSLYTATAYSGLAGLIGPSNVLDVTPSFQFRPIPSLLIASRWAFYWRYSRQDGVYGIFTNLQKSALTGSTREIGSQATLQAVWIFDQHLSVAAILSRFETGAFLKENAVGSDVSFIALGAGYRF